MDQEQEPELAKPEPRITEARALPPRPKGSSRKLVIFGTLAGAGGHRRVLVGPLFESRLHRRRASGWAHHSDFVRRSTAKSLEVLVDDNQQVKQGQVLVRIDPRDYQAKVDQAQAAVAVAESQAQGANAGVPLTRDTTGSSVTAAEAQLSRRAGRLRSSHGGVRARLNGRHRSGARQCGNRASHRGSRASGPESHEDSGG